MRNARSALSALFALAAVLLLLFSRGADIAEARRLDPVLVTNFAQVHRGSNVNDGLAQAFTTGSHVTGYNLTQIQVDSSDEESDDFSMQVCETDSNTLPTSTCWPLTAPDSFAQGRLTFTAPGGLHLRADAIYSAVVRPIGSGNVALSTTGSTAEDDRSLELWTIRDKFQRDTQGSWVDSGITRNFRLAIRGTVNTEGDQLISTIGQAGAGHTDEADVAQRFTTGFNPGGYRLTTVELRLTTRNDSTAVPTVTVHSHSPTGPEVAALRGPATLEQNTTENYTFAAPDGAILSPSTLHWLRIEAGSDVRIVNASGSPTLNTAADGWAIGRMVNVDDLSATGIQSRLLKFRVRGEAAPPPLLLGNSDGAPSMTHPGGFDEGDYAQGFTTGVHGGSFALYSIDLWLDISDNESFPTVTLRSGSPTGTKVVDFTLPSARALGLAGYTYQVAGPVTLNTSTSYWVVAEGSSSTTWRTVAGSVDGGSLSGWSFSARGQERKPNTATGSFSNLSGTARRFQLRFNGVQSTPPYLVSNLDQPLSETSFTLGEGGDVAKRFWTGGNPGGYTLNGASITLKASSPSSQVPTLTLHSGSATGTQLTSFTAPSSLQLGTKDYAFTPASSVALSASTEYWLVVQGGSNNTSWPIVESSAEDGGGAAGWSINTGTETRAHDSTGEFTSQVGDLPVGIRGAIVPPTNSAATGTPLTSVGNAYRVPAVVTANLGGISDANGFRGIAHTATYTWQRFASDGTTLEQDAIGTGSTYTLTGADVGKRVKVAVSFVDDAGHAEGPLTSPPTYEVSAAAACAAPTLAGDFEFIGGARTVSVARFGANRGFSASAGDLAGAQFTTTAGQTYEIVGAVAAQNAFKVTFDQSINAVDKARLALHVCDAGPYSFRDIGASETLSFTGSSVPNWSPHVVRRIYVSEDARGPTFADATVNGTSLLVTFHEPLAAAASLANSAFTVKKGSGGTEQTLTGTPSISGSTVTLTLATAVTATDTDVKIAYTQPSSGTSNRVVDAYGNEAETFGDSEVRNLLDDRTPPELDGTTPPALAADGRTLTVTFNEAMKSTSVPDRSAFTVKATPMGGSEETLALATSGGVTVSGSTAMLKLTKPIAHNDGSVKVSYTKPGNPPVLEDAIGNDLADFTDVAVTNNSTIPRVSLSAMHTDWTPGLAKPDLVLTRTNIGNSSLDVNYTVSGAHTTDDVGRIEAHQDTTSPSLVYSGNASGPVTITVTEGRGYLPAIAPNNAVTLDLKTPASGRYVTISPRQTSYTVTEGESVSYVVDFVAHEGVAQPRDTIGIALLTQEGTATINSDYRHISDNVTAEAGDWTARGAEWVASRMVTIRTEDDDEYEGANETFTAYLQNQQGVTNKITFESGTENALITIVDNDTLGVSSIEVTSTPMGDYYTSGEAITFAVTFNGSVTVDETSGTPQLAFDIDVQTRYATYASGSDSKVLVFSYTVAAGDGDDHDGISWGANALDRNNGTIKFTSTDPNARVDADLDHEGQYALPDQRVDTEKPTLLEARVLDTTLSLTYSEGLNTTAPSASAFSVSVAGSTEVNPTAVSISSRVVTLILPTTVTPGQTVTVSYTKPSNNPIKDLSGNEADGFTNESVLTTPPVAVVVQFAQSSYTVDEGSAVAVTVQLDKDPERTVTVPIVASGRGGAGPHDYAVPSDVTFTSGETQKTITFTTTQDSEDDEGEWVRLTFGMAPASVTQGSRAQTRITITDDDDPEVSVRFAVASYTADEGGSATVTVQLSAAPGRTVLVPITASEQGGATSADYSGVPANVTFGSGQTERTFTFRATQDAEDDDGEGVLLAFGTPLPPNVSAGTPDQTTVTIIDDDGPGVTISNRAFQVVQGGSATYQVWLNTQPASAVTITPSSDNVEVTLRPASLTFQPGQWNTPQTITVEAAAESAGQTATIGHTVSGYGSVTTGYDVNVTVVVAAAVIGGTGGGGGFGPAPIAPRFVDGFRTTRSLAVNARPGDAVGDPVAATHPEDDDVTYALSGADAGRFTVDETTGQIRLRDGGTLALGQAFNVTLTATDSAGFGAIIIVTIEVGEPSHHRYDLNRNGAIERGEVLAAMQDYFRGNIAKGLVLEVIWLYFNRL